MEGGRLDSCDWPPTKAVVGYVLYVYLSGELTMALIDSLARNVGEFFQALANQV